MKKIKPSPKYRTTHRFVGGRKGRISQIKFESLKKGDYFYLENSNGEIVVDHQGMMIFRALSKAHRCPNYSGIPGAVNYKVGTKGVA